MEKLGSQTVEICTSTEESHACKIYFRVWLHYYTRLHIYYVV